MTEPKNITNNDNEPTEAINLSDSQNEKNGAQAAKTPAHDADATFEVSGVEAAGESPSEAENQVEQQDALFEVNETSKGNACDDDTEEEKSVTKEKEQSGEAKKIEELTAQLAGAHDKYLRLMAEFDNFKRRSAKEYERLVEAANERLMKDITEVRENFERAFKSNAAGEQLLEGMRLIFSKLNLILEKHGLEVYAEAGQKFDPGVHDALMRMPHNDVAEDHIVEVHERGYKLKGNIIKHAKVVVSSGKPPKKQADEEATIEIK